MSTDKTNDASEFARQKVERGVLNEIVTEEQRQRQDLEALIAEMREEDEPCQWFAARLAAILKR